MTAKPLKLLVMSLWLGAWLACGTDPTVFEGEEYIEPDVAQVAIEDAASPSDAMLDVPAKPCQSGMHPLACQALASIGFNAVITQTLQTTSISGVTHLEDGKDPVRYTVGADFRTIDRDADGKRKRLEDLRNLGFVAWIRIPGRDGWGATSAEHIHSIFPGAKMKDNKVYQVRDYLQNKDGLAYHRPYSYAVPTREQKLAVIRLFNTVNSPTLSESLADQ